MKKTLTLTELSKHLGINKRTLFRMIKDGRFAVEPISQIYPRRWCVEHVDAWVLSTEGSNQ